MQIHELNNYTGDLDSGAYIAVDDGSDTGKVSATQLLENVSNEIEELDETLNARIDNIIAGGAAPSEAEIIDARLGANNVTYPSLGDAIREQIEDAEGLTNGYVEMIGKRTDQLLDYVTAEIITAFPNAGSIVEAVAARSVIIPVSVDQSSVITIHRGIVGSRFVVSSHTTKPAIGSSCVNTVTDNNGDELQITIDNTIKYLCLYFFNTSADTGLNVTDCLKSIMVNVGSYSHYQNYYEARNEKHSIEKEMLSSSLQNAADSILMANNSPAEFGQDGDATVIPLSWTTGYYYNTTTGKLEEAPTWAYSDIIQCDYKDVYYITNHSGSVLFFDEYDNYLGWVATAYNLVKPFVVPENAVYMVLNNTSASYKATDMTRVLDSTVKSKIFTQKNGAEIKKIYDDSYFVQSRYTDTQSGAIYSVGTFYGTGPLAIEPDHKYRISRQSQIVYYTAASAFLSAVVPSVVNLDCEQDITTPANAYYMAVNSLFADNAVFDMEYTPTIKTERKLDDKTVVCFGDSIIGNYAYGDNIPYQIEKHTGALVYNVGFGGCRMEYLNSDPQHTNPFSMVGIVNALEAGDWTDQDTYAPSLGAIIEKRLAILKSIDFDDVDIITISYGTNEYGYPQDDADNPLNVYTYGGATRYVIEKLATLYPHLKICFFTPIFRYFPNDNEGSDTHPHPTFGGKLTDNVDTLISVAREYKLSCIDMYYTSGINIKNWSYYLNADGTHPNSFGRELMGVRYAGELNRIF